jgi:hypothetical protein
MANRLAIMAAMLSLFLTPLARADEITYTYTGPAPADLSGSFTTSTPLTPNFSAFDLNAAFINVVSWSFTDGVQTWTPANSSFDGGAFVNPDGSFSTWNFSLHGTDGSVAFSITNLSAFYYEDRTPVGDTFNNNTEFHVKGSWTMGDNDADDSGPVSTPEPGSLFLLGAGLATLGAAIFLSGGSRFDYIRV